MYLPTSIPSPDPVLSQLHLGPLTIHTYALCILAGIVAAIVITQKRLARRGGNPEIVLDVVLWCVPLGLVGARFYHVFTHIGDYFYPGADPWDIIKIWDGGNALYGSLLGGALGAYIGCRRAGIRFLSFADAVAPALLVAQSIGRLGNWFNHELFGLPTTLPWGLQIESSNPKFPADAAIGTLFHPLFLYEIIWNLIGVAIILFLERKIRARWGRSLGLYLIWYGMGRSWLEAIRIDPTSDGFLGVPANMWTSFAAIALGLVIFIVQGIRHRGPEESVYREGFDPKDDDEPGDEAAVGEAPVEEPQDESTTANSGSRSPAAGIPTRDSTGLDAGGSTDGDVPDSTLDHPDRP